MNVNGKSSFLLLTISVALASSFDAFANNSVSPPVSMQTQMNHKVGVSTTTTQDHPEFECMIEPNQEIEIRSPIAGILSKVAVHRGSQIRTGQALAVLESSVEQSAAEGARFKSEAQGTIISAQSKLVGATAKAKRFDQLYQEKFVSAQARDDAENDRRQAEAELHVAQDNIHHAKLEYRQMAEELNRRTLRSPFNGVVVDQYLYTGALVGPSEGKKPIMKIAQTDILSVTAILPFKYFKQIKAGSNVIITPEPPFSTPVRAKVKIVDNVVDSTSGTFGVVAKIVNSKNAFPSGIRCKMKAE
jgi:RND family efflux transporter MFP subunit